MSNTIVSPSRIAAIGPPAAASGATCPAIRPRVAPENLPSVTMTTDSPSPPPADRACPAQHPGLPRPPLRPFPTIAAAPPGLARFAAPRVGRPLLAVDPPCRPPGVRQVRPRHFHHGTLGRQVALEDDQPP